MGVIIFNNKSSNDFGIEIESCPEYISPEKDYEIIHIPGKNGDVLIDKGSYKNIERTYDVTFGADRNTFTRKANSVIEWLHSSSGYTVLEDSYEPEYYRLAMYKEVCSIENLLEQAGKFTITFNCKPQRYLKTGDKALMITESSNIYNQTGFASLPIITINGSGNVRLMIGKYMVLLTMEVGKPVTIDSEIQDVYSGAINQNGIVTMPNGFPKLVAGNNLISISESITSLEVIPKWWTL